MSLDLLSPCDQACLLGVELALDAPLLRDPVTGTISRAFITPSLRGTESSSVLRRVTQTRSPRQISSPGHDIRCCAADLGRCAVHCPAGNSCAQGGIPIAEPAPEIDNTVPANGGGRARQKVSKRWPFDGTESSNPVPSSGESATIRIHVDLYQSSSKGLARRSEWFLKRILPSSR